MRRRTAILTAIAIGTLLLFFAARILAAPLLRPALGFAAKVSCSGVLVGGATVSQVTAGFPDERLRRLVRVRVDAEGGRASATLPLLGRRDAVYRDGLGCTLVPVRGAVVPLPAAIAASTALATDDTASAPDGTELAADGTALAADGTAPAARAPGNGTRELAWPAGDAVGEPAAAVDAARLRAVVDSAFTDADPVRPQGTHAIVIVQDGRIIAERYGAGYSAEHRLPGWSMAKSVTNALAGLLAAEGRIELTAAALRPEWRAPGDARAAITLGQLMQMSSGLDFEESYAPTGGATRMLFNSADVAATAAAAPLRHEPGRVWYYSSGTTNIISAHLRAAFGTDTAAYIEFPAARLFARIGMDSAVLEPDATGTFVGSSFMYATARDWARFGLLYLQDGVWQGERILPAGWVEYSVTPAPAAPQGRYGAQWWLNAGEPGDVSRRPWPELPADLYYASGFQGQSIVVVPSYGLVIVRLGATVDDGAWDLRGFLRGVLDAMRSRASA